MTVPAISDRDQEAYDRHGLLPADMPLSERLRRKFVPSFSEHEAHLILIALSNGMRITAIGRDAGMPAYWIINAWRDLYPDFDAAVVEASRAGAEKMLWDTIEIADDQERSPGCRDVSIKARLHAMKVLDRKRFDPAVKIDVTGRMANPDEMTDEDLARIAGSGAGRLIGGEG